MSNPAPGQNYAIFASKIYVADYDSSGTPKGWKWVGDSSKAQVSFTTEMKEHKEGYTGMNVTTASVIIGVAAKFEFETSNFSPENAAFMFNSTLNTTTSGTVTDETVGSVTTAVGDLLPLANVNVSAVTGVTDSSTGTPQALTEGTHYSVNYATGSLNVLSLPSGFTGPIVVGGYSYGASTQVGAFTQLGTEKAFRVEGKNTADGSSVVLEIFRAKVEPIKDVNLITKDFVTLAVTCDVLADPTKSSTDPHGDFVSFKQIPSAS